MMASITLDLVGTGAAWVHYRGGATSFATEAEAMAYVVRRQIDRPGLIVKIIAR